MPALYICLLFENKNTFLFLYFICLLLNLKMCQIFLTDPVYIYIYMCVCVCVRAHARECMYVLIGFDIK